VELGLELDRARMIVVGEGRGRAERDDDCGERGESAHGAPCTTGNSSPTRWPAASVGKRAAAAGARRSAITRHSASKKRASSVLRARGAAFSPLEWNVKQWCTL